MIVKIRVAAPFTRGKVDAEWLWLDHVSLVQSYGQFTEPRTNPVAEGTAPYDREVALFRSQAELQPHVDEMWGPMEVREFGDEVWPEFTDDGPGSLRSVTPVRIEREGDRRPVLALLADEAFLLSDTGDTIERLR